MGDGSGELEQSEVAAEPEPGLSTLNPRQRRARRRRHRRQLGTLIFVLVAAAVLATAYFAATAGDDSSDDATTTSGAVTTLTTAPFSATYHVTTGVNVRQGAGTSFPTVGTVETGKPVTVVCVAEGQPVSTPTGQNTQWLHISAPPPGGYVSAVFVVVGGDLTSKKIPACPAA